MFVIVTAFAWLLLQKTALIEFASNPNNASTSRTKAMQLAATIAHVESITLKGNNIDQLIVTGKEIDAVAITVLLQKKLGSARLIDYTPTKATKQIKETFRRVSYGPDPPKGPPVRLDLSNNRNGHPDPYNPRNSHPDHYNSRNGYHDLYSYYSSYPDSYNYGSQYQRRIDHEPYPVDQIEYVSYQNC